MVANQNNKTSLVVVAQKLIAGTAKHLTTATPVAFLGGTFTPAEITTKLQSIVTLRNDVETARAAASAKVGTETTSLPALRTFVSAFEAYLKVAFGASPDVLADFGITLKARATPTAVTKAAAVVKRDATRAARHTMGTQQKKAVKGDVTGITVTPVTTPQPAAAPAAPAAGATPVAPTTTTPHA
jgi:hypothetical protein